MKTRQNRQNISNKSKKITHFRQIPSIKLDYNIDPFPYFQELFLKYKQFGAVQLQVDWDMPCCIETLDKPINTIIQNMKTLTKGDSFPRNTGAYTVASFKRMALAFQAKYKLKAKNIEKEYWNQMGKDLQVEYASDISYRSGFPLSQYAGIDYSNNKFNLNILSQQKGSLFQVCRTKKEQISGVTNSWVYFGMMFSTFCWHTENMYLSALNYHHKGADKTWYIIPEEAKEKFDQYVNSKFSKGILQKISLQIDPSELILHSIPVYKCVQKAKTYILVFPKAYHCGFSHGFNITEAINVAMPQHLNYIHQSSINDPKLPIFPLEFLAIGQLELKIKYDPQDQSIINQYAKLYIEREIKLRNSISSDLAIISSAFSYYQNQCITCQHYAYLSFIQCRNCKWKSCMKCKRNCSSTNHISDVVFRYDNDQLNELLQQN